MNTNADSRIKIVLVVIFSLILTFTMMPMSVSTVCADTGDSQAQKAAETKTGDVAINETNFPDANFRDWVKTNLAGGGDTLTADMINKTTTINCSGKEISNLKGIEYFTALTNLNCNTNQLTSLDVSKNTDLTALMCGSNQLTSLDVSKNTALKELRCDYNQLTSLDVSKNTDLKELLCHSNQLTSLDVSSNTALAALMCGSNQLTGLDVSKNTDLTVLECGYNQLTNLDVSKNTVLEELYCGYNKLTKLDVSINTDLTRLYCFDNQLTSLDVSSKTALIELNCSSNQLTSLDVSNSIGLTGLDCGSNQLTSLDVSKNTGLEVFVCNSNQLTSLDLSKNTNLVSRYSTISPQNLVLKARYTGGKYVVDLKKNDPNIELSKVSNVSSAGGKYNSTAGTITFDSIPSDKVTYNYATNNTAKPTMDVSVTIKEGFMITYTKAKATGRYSVKVSWKKSKGATSYKVYKATKKAGKYKLVGTVKGTSKTVKKLKANKKYWFKVRAINKAEHATSKAVYAKTKKEPVSFTVKNTKGTSVKVHWKTVKGAKGYQVANNDTANGKMKTYWTGKNSVNTYTSGRKAVGKTYKFKMRYYKVKNGKKIYSSWTKAKTIKVR